MVIRSPGSPLIHSTRAVERQWVIVQPSHVALQWSSWSSSGSLQANPVDLVPAVWSPALHEPKRLAPVALLGLCGGDSGAAASNAPELAGTPVPNAT
jgi:hypothetical protein